MKALCMKMGKISSWIFEQNISNQRLRYKRKVLSSVFKKLRCVIITQTSSVLALEFASLTCTSPLMLFQSCLAMLRVCCTAKDLFYSLRSDTCECSKTKSGISMRIMFETLTGNIKVCCDLWIVKQTVSEKWAVCLLALCQTHSVAHLLISYFVFMSLNHSLRSLSLHHPLCSHSYSHTHRICLSFKHDRLIFRSFSSCDYVQADTCRSNLHNNCRNRIKWIFQYVTKSYGFSL